MARMQRKIRKLVLNPNQFFLDFFAKRVRRKKQQKPAEAKAPKPNGAPKKKSHPLPTLNLATELLLSDAEVQIFKREPDYLRYRASYTTRERVLDRVAQQVERFFAEHGFAAGDCSEQLREFLLCYEANPAAKRSRTTSLNGLLWLFLLAKRLEPQTMVESGVLRGASLYTLRHAQPEAELFAFDINLAHILFEDDSITFHEGDWSEAFPSAKGDGDLCYFDDHCSNCLRIRQAYELGFRHLVFDDSTEIGQLHKWRTPGVPTVQMVHNRTLEPGEFVEWVNGKQKERYVFEAEHTHGIEDLLELVVELPQLASLTGRNGGIQTYVRLKENTSATKGTVSGDITSRTAEGELQQGETLTDEQLEAHKKSGNFFQFETSPNARQRVIRRLSAQFAEFFEQHGFDHVTNEQDVEDFLKTFPTNPAAGMPRTTALGGLLWLHMLARALRPSVVVESGVFRGASLFALYKAYPSADFYAFDIDMSNLVIDEPDIAMHEGDWSEVFPRAKSPNDLCYFDDHISNCLRIREAYELGYKHLVFDDSPDIGQLHKWRYPGVPTVQMVMNETLEYGEYVEWVWTNKKQHYVYRQEHAKQVLDIIDAVVELPSTTALTGRGTGTQAYVRLK